METETIEILILLIFFPITLPTLFVLNTYDDYKREQARKKFISKREKIWDNFVKEHKHIHFFHKQKKVFFGREFFSNEILVVNCKNGNKDDIENIYRIAVYPSSKIKTIETFIDLMCKKRTVQFQNGHKNRLLRKIPDDLMRQMFRNHIIAT
jgi:hypothetical protein